MIINFNLYVIVSFLFIVGMILFILFLLTRPQKTDRSKALIWLTLALLTWMILDLATSFSLRDEARDLFIWRIGFVAAFLTSLTALRFTLVYLKKQINNWLVLLTTVMFLAVSWCILLTDKIIKGIKPLAFPGQSNYYAGEYFYLVFFVITLPILVSLVYSFIALVRSNKKEEKKQFKFLFLGLLVPVIVAPITNMLFPIFDIAFPKLGTLTIFVGMMFFFYAIYKWSAFDIVLKLVRIKTKLILALILLSLVPIFIVTAILYTDISGILLDKSLSDERHDVMMKKDDIENFLANANSDILFLSKLENLNALINSSAPITVNSGFFGLYS